jgi:hypothetical protein
MTHAPRPSPFFWARTLSNASMCAGRVATCSHPEVAENNTCTCAPDSHGRTTFGSRVVSVGPTNKRPDSTHARRVRTTIPHFQTPRRPQAAYVRTDTSLPWERSRARPAIPGSTLFFVSARTNKRHHHHQGLQGQQHVSVVYCQCHDPSRGVCGRIRLWVFARLRGHF